MKSYLLLLLILLSFQAQGQLGIKVMHFDPTGDQGVLFEKRFAAELMYVGEFKWKDDNWRMRCGLSYIPLESRLDSFPTYAVMSGGNGTAVLPGYEVYHKYNMGYIYGGMDWAFLDREPFYMFFGADVLIGGINMEYESHYETFMDESFSGGQFLGGLRVRGGAQYFISDAFSVLGEFTRSYYFVEEMSFQSHFDYGLGVVYYFNN